MALSALPGEHTDLRANRGVQTAVSQLLLLPAVHPPRQTSHTTPELMGAGVWGSVETNGSDGCGVQAKKSMVFIKSFPHQKQQTNKQKQKTHPLQSESYFSPESNWKKIPLKSHSHSTQAIVLLL